MRSITLFIGLAIALMIIGLSHSANIDEIRIRQNGTENPTVQQSPAPAKPAEIVASAPEDKPKLSGDTYGIMYGDILVPETVAIPGGSFNMGQPNPHFRCRECSKDEQPVHRVEISPFEIGRFEVTNSQYNVFSVATGRENAEWHQYFTKGHGNHPVVNVTWNDAVAYCAWLQANTNREYRLPTEAEWEYAARAHTANVYIDKNSPPDGQARFNNKSGPNRVGFYKPNNFGLFDMIGNAWEWCSDWYDQDYYSKSPTHNPQGPSQGQYRVIRGGGWDSTADLCRVANRTWYNTGFILDGRGFRVVVSKKE